MTSLIAHIGPVPAEEMLIGLPAVGMFLGILVSRFRLGRQGRGGSDE